jgi:hypothetical protein
MKFAATLIVFALVGCLPLGSNRVIAFSKTSSDTARRVPVGNQKYFSHKQEKVEKKLAAMQAGPKKSEKLFDGFAFLKRKKNDEMEPAATGAQPEITTKTLQEQEVQASFSTANDSLFKTTPPTSKSLTEIHDSLPDLTTVPPPPVYKESKQAIHELKHEHKKSTSTEHKHHADKPKKASTAKAKKIEKHKKKTVPLPPMPEAKDIKHEHKSNHDKPTTPKIHLEIEEDAPVTSRPLVPTEHTHTPQHEAKDAKPEHPIAPKVHLEIEENVPVTAPVSPHTPQHEETIIPPTPELPPLAPVLPAIILPENKPSITGQHEAIPHPTVRHDESPIVHSVDPATPTEHTVPAAPPVPTLELPTPITPPAPVASEATPAVVPPIPAATPKTPTSNDASVAAPPAPVAPSAPDASNAAPVAAPPAPIAPSAPGASDTAPVLPSPATPANAPTVPTLNAAPHSTPLPPPPPVIPRKSSHTTKTEQDDYKTTLTIPAELEEDEDEDEDEENNAARMYR